MSAPLKLRVPAGRSQRFNAPVSEEKLRSKAHLALAALVQLELVHVTVQAQRILSPRQRTPSVNADYAPNHRVLAEQLQKTSKRISPRKPNGRLMFLTS